MAEILFRHDYDEGNLLTANIKLFSVNDSDNDMAQKLQQLQALCVTCGRTPADELKQPTLVLLRTFGFSDDQPKKKLMTFLETQRNKNANALTALSDEWTGRMGLNELADEGIYEVDVSKLVESSIIEVDRAHKMHNPNFTSEQESLRNDICTRLGQECDDNKCYFQIDSRIDKKTFKRGRQAAKIAAKFHLRERLPESVEWSSRKGVVDRHNALMTVRAEKCSYHDHLPFNEFKPFFKTHDEVLTYAADFEQVYDAYLGEIRRFI